ncbi:uncharacterized protein EAE98_002807 [Botrytis deweyae]|uniref:MYND-type domain-containing protein n=1 Tax=Botrytis deweyae TaxID=2478750 RepID=A0ABQ7IVL6_9HELO|nr:uncharacterized protein EAE98_002807 [Botrytis deweyae]KAF7934762.1 hypothetical protein EAE98_002807 [Botrytis deweyae]
MSRKWISTFAPPEASQHPPDCPQYQSAPVDLTPKCAFCNVTGAKQRCAGCKTLFYCNEQCQKGDWKLHKLVCRPYADFTTNVPRPANGNLGPFKLVILLPVNEKQPQFLWLETCQRSSTELSPMQALTSQALVKWLDLSGVGRIDTTTLRLNIALLESFPDDSRYWHRQLEIKMPAMPTHNILQTPINKCASKLASNCMTFGHRGAMIVVHRVKGTRSIGDAQPSDLRIVADWLRRHVPTGMKDYQIKYSFQGFTNEINILEELHHAEKSAAPKVSAVRIHCEGGTEILKLPKYESIEISTADYAFLHEDIECTKALGIRLVLRSFIEPYDYQNVEGQHELALRTNTLVPHRNEEALFLFLTIDPEDESWGGLSPKDMVRFPLQEIGSFQVVRKDKKSITVHQVEVIANYFRRVVYFEMGNLIHRYKDARPPTVEKEKVTKGLLNRDAFEKYFGEFKKAKIEGGDQSWADAISPFDI